ncbi:MAG: hypothetical protein IKK21_04880 [Clostridia bacterium]|nr:hypothetical protein [Clostridia bacterium]
MDRILILMAADCYEDADRALRSARDNAASAQRISYGLTLREEPDQPAMDAMLSLGTVQFLAPAEDPWRAMPALWQGEGFVLLAHAAMEFTRHWDMTLLAALRACRGDHVRTRALTGILPSPADPVDAVSPVAAAGFDTAGRLCFHKGTPLRYAKTPQVSAFVNPYFCFAPAHFFQEMSAEEPPLFLGAFRRGWSVYTLHKPCIHMTFDYPLPPADIPLDEGRSTGLARFDAKFSVRLGEKRLSAMARTGIFTADLRFPIHVPAMVRLQEALRDWRHSLRDLAPLCVTARLDLPGEPLLADEAMARFARLCAIKALPLLCFASGDTARKILRMHPNVLDYKSRYGLPVRIQLPEDEMLNFFRLSKIYLLAQGREKYLSHSHYAWIDFGYLKYPVYERAALDWSQLCTDQVVIATVNGVPDPSMFVIPEEHLTLLCRDTLSLCEEAVAKGLPLPRETDLWTLLIHKHPDLIATVELPSAASLLDKTMMTRKEEFHVLA